MTFVVSSPNMGSPLRNTYDQSAVVPFVLKDGALEILLITNRSGKRWVIPKGFVEDDLTAQQSAAREAYEEAGIKGKVYEESIGEYRYRKWQGTLNVAVFLFEVHDVLEEWPEFHFRERAWLSVDEAAELVDEKALKKIIRRVPKLIDTMSIR